ncbi:MAG: dihydroorotate dehydrogenase-like protein [Spirochaetaceae bacterium]|nr:dihydroorotate dehydrogenase-like protein [Spirochaetaceae bacterium]
MANLKTNYMGLKLKNPIIAASGPLTSNLDSLKKLEDAGASAVVIKSIFQEQIDKDAISTMEMDDAFLAHADAYGFLLGASEDYFIDQYLTLVEDAKKALSIPVIASLNGSGSADWISEYAPRFASCGADAIELNHYEIGSNYKLDGKQIERNYIKFAKIARKEIKIPLALKIGSCFSAPANIMHQFDFLGINGLVLFNKFYNPDIDIETLEMKSGNPLSDNNDFYDTLRWVSLMSEELRLDLCANTGIHSSSTIIKMLLAGASTVELCSVLMKNGVGVIETFLKEINEWMDRKGFNEISDFKGKLAQEAMVDPTVWERTQYVKSIHNIGK